MNKSILIFIALIPGFVSASTSLFLAGLSHLPKDFEYYFLHSEVPVQVYLNDKPLFEASMRMWEDGKIKITSIIAREESFQSDIQDSWENILKKGIETGKCTEQCPMGLLLADYNLNNSTLRLLTSVYEKERVKGNYIDLPDSFPAGLVVNNDFSASQLSAHDRRWSLNTGWTSSYFNWSQFMALQSTHVGGQYGYDVTDLYNFYTQKELSGHFIRIGFFTPDNDSGNVMTNSFGYSSVIGAMWGTSDILLNNSESVSAWPVYVTGRNQSVAEVWREGRLLHTQQLQDGIQALDTRRLPGGIYDITIRVLDNGQLTDTQIAQIYKPGIWRDPSRHWRANVWAGQQQTVSSQRRNQQETAAIGGSVDWLAWTGGIIGASASALDNDDYSLRLKGDITLTNSDSLFLQHTRSSYARRELAATDIRYYRNFTAGIGSSLYWRNSRADFYEAQNRITQSNAWGHSLNTQFHSGVGVTTRVEYQRSSWRRGVDTDMSLTTRHSWFSRDADVRLTAYDRAGYAGGGRDRGAAVSLTMSLFPADSRHYVSAALGINEGQEYSSAMYQWSPADDSILRGLGAGLSHSGNMATLSANGSVDARYLNGDGFVQRSTSADGTVLGINLTQTMAIGEGQVGTSRQLSGQRALMIIDVEDESGAGIIVSGSLSDKTLKPGRNVVPVNLWQREILQFTSVNNSSKVTPERVGAQMNRGSVGYIKVKSTQTQTMIAVLRDGKGHLLTESTVSAGADKGYVNSEGVLNMDIAESVKTLNVYHSATGRSLLCQLPEADKSSEEVQYLNNVQCHELKTGSLNEKFL